MDKRYVKLIEALAQIRERTSFVPKVALVLGSGLGGYARNMEVEAEIPYSEIKGFPVSTVQGHDGRFLFGTVSGVPVAAMKGRVHYYEGYDISDVVMPARLMGLMGAKVLFLTNAAGGIDLSFSPGDLMLIRDHINLSGNNPLIGDNLSEFGPRFPDMTYTYDRDLREKLKEAASKEGIDLCEGVYAMFTGPSFETPAEIIYARTIGADAAGMSTVPEAIIANHAGREIIGISLLSNMAAGVLDQPLTAEEVNEAGRQAREVFARVVDLAIEV